MQTAFARQFARRADPNREAAGERFCAHHQYSLETPVRDLTAASIAICLAIAIAFAFSLVVKVNPAAAASEGAPVVVQGSDVTAKISLSSDHASPGHQLGVAVNVAV